MQNENRRKVNIPSAVKFALAMLLAVAMFFGGMFVLNNKISQKQATVQIDSDTTATVDDNVDADTTDRNYVGSYYQFKEVAEVGSNVDGWSVPKGTASCFSNFGTNLGKGKTSWSVPKGTASCFSNFGTNLGEGKTSFKLHGARKKWVTVWHRVNVGDYYNGKSIRFTCDYSFSTSPNNGGVRFGLYSSAPSNGDPGDGLASTRMGGTSGTAQFTYKMNTSDTYYLALGFGDMPDDTDVNVTLSNLASGISVKNWKGEDSSLIIDGTMTYGQLAPVKLGDTNSAKIIRGVRVNRLPSYSSCSFYSYNSSSSSVDTYGYLYDSTGVRPFATDDNYNENDSYGQPMISFLNVSGSGSTRSSLIFGVGLKDRGTMASNQIFAYARGYEAQVGSTNYTMLENAIKKASAGSTVKIIASSLDTVSNDISKTLTITSDTSTTITWDTTRQSSASDAMFKISGSATVTFGGSNTIKLDGGSKNYQRAINISSANATCNLSSVTIQYFKNTSLNGGAIYSKGILKLSGKAKIDDNSATYGGGIYIASGGTATMTDGTISNNTAKNGGGIYSRGDLTISGGTISNNSGGGIFVGSGTLNMTGGTISDNSVLNGQYGGGIYSYGKLTISGGTISRNKANGNGGGICFNSSRFTLTISDKAEIDGNSAENGAGIYVMSGTAKMTGGTISNNEATSSGGGIYSSGNLTISGGKISGNKTKDSLNGSGGGIYFHSSDSTLTISGTAEINGNSATNGGGIYIDSGTATMTGGTISNNTATTQSGSKGGGIYSSGNLTISGDTATMTGGTISNNTATSSGGGIESSGNLTISDTAEINENSAAYGAGVHVYSGTATMTGGTISNNTATSSGGGIESSGNLTISGGTISKNTATTYGGGIYSSGKLTISGGTISGNEAKDSNGLNGSGGGIYFNYSSGTLAISDTAEINENSAAYGAGVYVNSGTMEMTGGTISKNIATTYGGGIDSSGTLAISGAAKIDGNSADSGGGIYIASGTLNMTGGTISGNKANGTNGPGDGGGIFSLGNLTISGGTISDNTADEYGGGIFSLDNLTINGGTISNNTADYGGGNYIASSGTATMTGGTISNNTASTNGGGIYSEVKLTISGGTISKNTATKNGGGIYFDYSGGTLAISDTAEINENSATYGGGIYIASGTLNMNGGTIGTLAISDTAEIDGNSATNGAGVYVNSGTMEMTGGTISNNTASTNGGTISNNTASTNGGTISNHTASTNGGGIYAKSDLTISGGTISGNKAEGPKDSYSNGGGIYFDYSSGTLEISGTANIYGNSATFGGGIHSIGNLTISGGTISNNTASSNYIGNPEGGGIYSRGNLTISGGTISKNTATYYTIKTNGGGIYIDSGTATMTGGTISKNTANKGGGIFSCSTLTISGGTISDNTAGDGGGIYFNYSSGTLAISDTAEIDGNSATNGGGVYVYSGTLKMTGGTIGTLTISDKAEIDGNSAKYGAGVYVNSGTMTMTGGTISGNTATNSGGGIYSAGNLTISGGTISGNKAEGSNGSGGGIYFTSSYFTLTISGKAKIDGNSADSGAGIYVMSGIMTMTSGTISNNTATNNGGGICSLGNLTISGGTISGNKTNSVGGGIYSSSTLTISDKAKIDRNSAIAGGGVYLKSGTMTMTGGTISNNTADNGGGIYSSGNLTISGGIISGNSIDIYTTKDFTLSGVGNDSKYIDGCVYLANNAKILRTNNADSVEQWLAAGSKIEIENAKSGYVVFDYTNSSNTAMVSDYGKVSIANNGYELAVNGKTLILNATQYTITYNLNGGSGVEKSQTYNIETNLTLYGTPNRAGYTFGGWKVTTASGNWKKDATFTASQNVGVGKYGSPTLTAQWTPIQYTITYALNDGTGVEKSQTYNSDTNLILYGTPNRAGYTFDGWKVTTASGNWTKDATFTASQNVGTGKYGSPTLTAQWTPTQYTITYNLNGGVEKTNPTTYTVEDTFTLNNPTKTGYTFTGWTGTGLSSATKQVTIAKGSTGNRTYTANWTINSLTFAGANLNDATFASAYTSNAVNGASNGTGNYKYEIVSGAPAEIKLSVDESNKLTFSTTKVTSNVWTYTIVVKATDTTSDATANATFVLNIVPATIVYEVNSYSGVYDGNAHTISVAVTTPTSGVTIKYGTAKGTYNLTSPSTRKDVGKTTVYVQISAQNYTTVETTGTITITQATLSTPTELGWNKGVASWKAVNGIGAVTVSYQVVLYKGTTAVTNGTVTVSTNKYDFSALIRENGTGTYTFKVTAISSVPTNVGNSEQSSASGNQYAVKITVAKGTGIDTATINSTSSYVVINGESGIAIVAKASAGYTFKNWTTNNDAVKIASSTTPSTTISLTLTKQLADITITANTNANAITITWNGNAKAGDLILAKLWNYAGSAGYTSSNTGSNSKYTTNGVIATSSVTYNTALGYYSPLPIRRGYTFNGWFTSATNGTKVADATGSLVTGVSGYTDANKKWINASATTLYAQWTAKTYTISYDYAGGNATNPKSYNVGTTGTIKAPTRTGYTFAGWNIVTTLDKMYNGTINLSNGVMEYDSGYPNATFFEMFYLVNGITYKDDGTVGDHRWRSYNATTGEFLGNMSASVSETGNGTNIMLWPYNGDSNATRNISFSLGATDIDLATQKFTGNLKLFANWTINSYTLTIKPNGGVYGGKTTDTTITQNYNTKYTVANPTRTGYTFGGWDKTGEGTLTDTTFKFGAGNATLTAKWTINKSKLTIDPNGGSVKVGSETITESKTYEQNYNTTLSIAVPTRTGYTFAGWEKSKTFNGELSSTTGAATYTFGATSGTTDRITATWETINYTITYNANGGNAVASMTYTIETNTFTLATTTRTGYVFAGWKVTAKSGSAMANKVAVTVGNIISQIDKGSYADIIVEAQWTANSYKVAYNGNGATGGATATSEHTYDVVKELTSNGFVRNYTVTYNYNGATGDNTKANDVAKYTFAGWTGATAGKYGTSKNAVTNNASGATLPNGAYVLNLATTGTVTLSAKWNAVSISLPQPTKAGYTFAGWYLDNKFTNKVENNYTPAADVTLYAKWTANEFIIDYENINANSVAQIENLASLPRKYTYGQSQTLVSATSKNYTFDGWYLDKAKTTKVGLQLTSEQTQVVGRITLYANWTYTIVFNTNAPAGTTVTGVANKGMNSGDSYAIAEKLTLNGYRFLGWTYGKTTINAGDIVADYAGTGITQLTPANSQVTLTASWDKDERTVTVQYKVNGYTLNGKTIADYYGTSSNINETPNVKPATGTIEWNSNQYVVKYKYAEKVQFNIVTDGMYNFTIKVDNVDVTKQVSNGTYTIDSLTKNKSIVVEFTIKTFTVTITQKSPKTGTLHDLITKNNINYTPGVVRDENNEVVADGKYTFVYGERLTYYFAVNSGYIIGALKDGDTSVALNNDTYLIGKLTSDHNLVIEYTEQDTWLSYATDGKLTTGPAGTSTDPYIIDSAEKLAELAKLVFTGNTFSGKYFIVKTDISLAHPASDVSKSPYWFPIGINESIHFAGNFNGDGYTVSDMEVLNGTSIGLFGYSAGTIYNVKVSGSVTGSEIVGGVVGTNAGTVNYAENNATLIGKIGSSRTILGGVVGYNTSNGKIHAAANAGAIGGQFYYAGGIAGKNGGSIYNAYNSREITSSTSTQAFGGIVGYSTNGNIGYIYNYGKIANRDNKVAGQFVGQIEGTETVNIKGYYLNEKSSATNSYDTGLDRSKTQMKPATTYIFNTTSIYAGWNLATNNQYLDNIWEIRANENDGYPVFKIQKNYKGEIVITSEYAKDAESFAMGFVKVTIGKKVYTFMLGKGKTYKLEGLEAGEYTVTTYASTNHTATAHRTNASGEVLGSVTLNETTTSVTIYIVIAKTGTGTFYGGAGIVGGSTSTNTTAMANEVEMVEYTEELDEKSEELESEVVQNNEETREEVETDTENDTQSNAEVVIPQPHFIATARIETKLNRVSKMEQISVKTKPSIPNSKTTMAENMAYMAEVKSTHIVPVHNKKTLV